MQEVRNDGKWKLRLVGACVLFLNIWAIGRFDLSPLLAAVFTFGFAFAFEFFAVRAMERGKNAALAAGVTIAVFLVGLAFVVPGYSTATEQMPTVPEPPNSDDLLSFPIGSLSIDQFNAAQAVWQQQNPGTSAFTNEIGEHLSAVYRENGALSLRQSLDEAWRRVQAAARSKAPDYVVDRGAFGGCPTGYVDHPADPAKCALPVVAERMLDRASPRRRSRDDD